MRNWWDQKSTTITSKVSCPAAATSVGVDDVQPFCRAAPFSRASVGLAEGLGHGRVQPTRVTDSTEGI